MCRGQERRARDGSEVAALPCVPQLSMRDYDGENSWWPVASEELLSLPVSITVQQGLRLEFDIVRTELGRIIHAYHGYGSILAPSSVLVKGEACNFTLNSGHSSRARPPTQYINKPLRSLHRITYTNQPKNNHPFPTPTPKVFPSDMPRDGVAPRGGLPRGGVRGAVPPCPCSRGTSCWSQSSAVRAGTLGQVKIPLHGRRGAAGEPRPQGPDAGPRWVKENIRALGGDPFRVTLFGQGAGAAAAHLQVLSPQAAGLFSRVILQSGNALSPWALRCDHRKNAAVVGAAFGCAGVDSSSPADLNSTALLDCLRELPFEQLAVIPSVFVTWLNAPQVMTPRVDGSFLPAHPALLLRDGRFNRVSLISGVNQEGALPALATLETPFLKKALTERFPEVGPVILNVQEEKNAVLLARQAFSAYLPQYRVNEDTVGDFAKLLGDEAFRIPHREVVRLHSMAGGLVFAYELKHRGLQSLTDIFNTSAGDSWVSNGDDLQYLFNGTTFPPLKNLDDRRLSDLMVIMWTNFAATRYPTPDSSLGFWWTPVGFSSPMHYLCLTPTPTMAWDGRSPMYEFWTSLPTFQNRVLHPSTSLARPGDSDARCPRSDRTPGQPVPFPATGSDARR
ncbi:JHE-like carboxylesterase 1 [Penaeus vannamei]|uniref:JHE-like carboxylesterase 1 n=1 Tax=Penaeus vannamei TaxID=6689 RepID=A0A423SUQ3_PENVA|nr:JHE-like carboxylesterase 1 [Penaeus vannamei]